MSNHEAREARVVDDAWVHRARDGWDEDRGGDNERNEEPAVAALAHDSEESERDPIEDEVAPTPVPQVASQERGEARFARVVRELVNIENGECAQGTRDDARRDPRNSRRPPHRALKVHVPDGDARTSAAPSQDMSAPRGARRRHHHALPTSQTTHRRTTHQRTTHSNP